MLILIRLLSVNLFNMNTSFFYVYLLEVTIIYVYISDFDRGMHRVATVIRFHLHPSGTEREQIIRYFDVVYL